MSDINKSGNRGFSHKGHQLGWREVKSMHPSPPIPASRWDTSFYFYSEINPDFVDLKLLLFGREPLKKKKKNSKISNFCKFY